MWDFTLLRLSHLTSYYLILEAIPRIVFNFLPIEPCLWKGFILGPAYPM